MLDQSLPAASAWDETPCRPKVTPNSNTEKTRLFYSRTWTILMQVEVRSAMSKCIMIVDDNELVRRQLRFLFEASKGWTVCAEAVNGRDAVEKAQEFHPDFVLLDYSMPVMDGLKAAPQLRGINPESHIVMYTAFKDTALEEQAYQAGVTWVLAKTEGSMKVLDLALVLLVIAGPPNRPGTEEMQPLGSDACLPFPLKAWGPSPSPDPLNRTSQ